ncbi:MAG: hypothetical protein J6V01_00330 [Clostridia bacterium]|nr:hypothetical protein [Clostridia bacterium]
MYNRTILRAARAALLTAALAIVLCSCSLIINEYDETPRERTTALAHTDGTFPELTAPPVPGGIAVGDVTAEIPDLEAVAEPLPDRDYSDRALTVAVVSETVCTMMPDESSPFYAACALRNDAVIKKYGTVPQFIFYTRQEVSEGIKKTQASGGTALDDFYADVVEMPARSSGVLALSGLLVNLHSLPFYTAPEGGSASAGSLIGRLWFEISETVDDPGALLVLLCRRDATSDGGDALYGAALSGNFTFDLFLETAVGTMTADDGLKAVSVSSSTDAGILGEAAVLRSGLRYTGDITNGRELTWAKGELKETVSSLIGRLSSVTCTGAPPEPEGVSPYELFQSGRAAFYVCTLEELDSTVYAGKTDYLLLPLPYSSDAPAGIAVRKNVLCVPVINRRSEMTGILLNAYRAFSGDWIRESYLPEFASEKMRDSNSLFTLKLILRERSAVDFAEIMCDSIRDLGNLTVSAAWGGMRSDAPLSELTDKAVTALNKLLAQNRK